VVREKRKGKKGRMSRTAYNAVVREKREGYLGVRRGRRTTPWSGRRGRGTWAYVTDGVQRRGPGEEEGEKRAYVTDGVQRRGPGEEGGIDH